MLPDRGSFYVKRLSLVGAHVEPAEVAFVDGLNLVEGASDTGTSYILSALEWCLGAQTPPKRIDESEGYDSAILTIFARHTELEWTLRRSLQGGKITAELASSTSDDSNFSVQLSAKHVAKNENNISTFLLNICGATGRRIRVNADGETKSLTFPTIRKLAFVDETRIISNASPFSSGERGDATRFRSTMRILMTGVDDSQVIAREPRVIARARSKGWSDALDDVIKSLQFEAEAQGSLPSSVDDAIQNIQTSIAAIQSELRISGSAISSAQKVRHQCWTNMQNALGRRAQVQSLVERFLVLRAHYDSDLERLRSSVESADLFVSIPEGRCVLCGSDGKHRDDAHVPSFRAACAAEEGKLERLRADLDKTIENLVEEESGLAQEVLNFTTMLGDFDSEFETRIQPLQHSLSVSLQDLLEQRASIERRSVLEDQILRMRKQRDFPVSELKLQPDEGLPQRSGYVATELTNEIECHLREWKFANVVDVRFDVASDDVVINGKARTAFGKGYRAIAHAACTIALMTVAQKNGLIHPGLVVLDSPLNPYEGEVDDDGELSDTVKKAFLESLGSGLSDRQVIILDNDLPHTEVSINRIKFSRSFKHGRYGFFPVHERNNAIS